MALSFLTYPPPPLTACVHSERVEIKRQTAPDKDEVRTRTNYRKDQSEKRPLGWQIRPKNHTEKHNDMSKQLWHVYTELDCVIVEDFKLSTTL